PAPDFACDGADLDCSRLDLRDFELEQRLDEQAIGAAQHEARTLGRLLDLLEDCTNWLTLMIVLAMILLAVRHHGFCLTEAVEHDDELAALDLLHLTAQQLANARRELVADLGALALAHALQDALLRGLHGRASEFCKIGRNFHYVADLEFRILEARFFERDLACGVLDLLDHGLEQHDADGAALFVDVDFGLHWTAVLLGERGEDTVLQKIAQLRTIH